MHDNWLDEELQRSLGARPKSAVPDFDTMMEAAAKGRAGNRMRYPMVAAAFVLALVAIGTHDRWSTAPGPVDDELMIAEAMLDNTLWRAPSDSLLPQHRFDIYREIPTFIESTELEEGTLL